MELELFYFIISVLSALPVLGFIGSGSGTEGDPYIVDTVDKLNDMRNELDAVYHGVAGVTLDVGAETDNSGGTYWNTGEGWATIGAIGANVFSGTFDGKGMVIDGLFINSSTGAEGLMGEITGTVRNLNFTTPNITAAANGAGVLTSVVGSGGVVEKVRVFGGSVSVGANNLAGGIVGEILSGGTVQNCYNEDCTVTGEINVGGVVGRNNGTVKWLIGNTTVTGTTNDGVTVGNNAGMTGSISIYHNATKQDSAGAGYPSTGLTTAELQDLAEYNAVTGKGIGQNIQGLGGGADGTSGTSTITSNGGAGLDVLAAGNQIRIQDGTNAEVHTVDTIVGPGEITITGTLANTYDNAELFHAEAADVYDIVTEGSHDGQEATAAWFIDDGNAAPELWYEYNVATDSTPPTLPADTTLTRTPLHAAMQVDFNKATGDDTDATTAFIYRLWRASAGTDISTAALCNSNGTEVASDTDVATLTGAVTEMTTPYEWNITVEDTSGNQAAYTQAQEYSTIYGNVKDAGVNDGEAIVEIKTLAEATDPAAQPTFVETANADANGDWYMSAAYDETVHYLVETRYWETQQSGTADGGTASTLNDAGAFSAGVYDGGGYAVRTTGGTGSGQTRKISTNTADDLNVTPGWTTNPDATTTYEVVQWQSDEPQLVLRVS